jgi:hypothetical protein
MPARIFRDLAAGIWLRTGYHGGDSTLERRRLGSVRVVTEERGDPQRDRVEGGSVDLTLAPMKLLGQKRRQRKLCVLGS